MKNVAQMTWQHSWACGLANVAPSTVGRRLLLSGSFHMISVMFLSNRHSARDGAGGAESTSSTVGRIMVHNECVIVDGQVPLAPCLQSCQCFGKCILPWWRIESLGMVALKYQLHNSFFQLLSRLRFSVDKHLKE